MVKAFLKKIYRFMVVSLQKNMRRVMVVSEIQEGGRYYEADTENTRRSGHRGADRFRLDLCAGAPLFGHCVRPCRNGPWHLRCAGADHSSGYKRDHPTGDSISRQSMRNPHGGGVAARQNTGFAVCDSGPGLRLKRV